MSHWAQINNNIVVNVVVGDNNDSNGDEGFQWLIENHGGRWIKTSYNTHGGVHYDPETNKPSIDQSKALRKNYAGIGYHYDENLDAFIEPKPYPSWILNEETCTWQPPVKRPEPAGDYYWDEKEKNWILGT